MKLIKAEKEIIWGFAEDLKYAGDGHSVDLSQFKVDGECYHLEIDGTLHKPKSKREVYRILRKVDPEFTEWWEDCNQHYYKNT